MTKTLYNSDASGTRENVIDVAIFGDVDKFQLLFKASSLAEGWMKSTKAMTAGTGVVIQVTTQQRNPDHSWSIAEALTYVPDCYIAEDEEHGGRCLVGR